MKGFLITTLIVVALLITGISQVSNICQSFYDKVLELEGGPTGPMREAFDKVKDTDPAQFKQKFNEPFQNRLKICKAAFFLGGDDIFKTIAVDTHDRYLGTLFDKEEGFDVLLFRLARTYEDRQPSVYYEHLVEIKEHFPNCDFMPDLDTKIKLMKVRLNIASSLCSPATFC